MMLEVLHGEQEGVPHLHQLQAALPYQLLQQREAQLDQVMEKLN
jgi:hypothetical protein